MAEIIGKKSYLFLNYIDKDLKGYNFILSMKLYDENEKPLTNYLKSLKDKTLKITYQLNLIEKETVSYKDVNFTKVDENSHTYYAPLQFVDEGVYKVTLVNKKDKKPVPCLNEAEFIIGDNKVFSEMNTGNSIFPNRIHGGVDYNQANNSVNIPTVNNEKAFFYGTTCNASFDPEAYNALISELANIVIKSGNKWNTYSQTNLYDAIMRIFNSDDYSKNLVAKGSEKTIGKYANIPGYFDLFLAYRQNNNNRYIMNDFFRDVVSSRVNKELLNTTSIAGVRFRKDFDGDLELFVEVFVNEPNNINNIGLVYSINDNFDYMKKAATPDKAISDYVLVLSNSQGIQRRNIPIRNLKKGEYFLKLYAIDLSNSLCGSDYPSATFLPKIAMAMDERENPRVLVTLKKNLF